ncbi:methyl-accepting chemotaxis protein [Duganella sp. 1224]|uniref:methyl-accepting chemotaxis protein n=1 Tax=Duganella sp. 1224 TaxID=2587052 RepID=UPI0015CCD312|nr:methyl-accepting chemotaxis protein [Duganella sp. 1224]NYE62003.1 methyl-accepting chemotaxis protein [Duganella sp. 1224]
MLGNIKIRTALAAVLALFCCALGASLLAGWLNARAAASAMEAVVHLSDRQLGPLHDTERLLLLTLSQMDNAYIDLLRGDQIASNDNTRKASDSLKAAQAAFGRYRLVMRDDPQLTRQSATLVRNYEDYAHVLGLREQALYEVSLDQYAAATVDAQHADASFAATLRQQIVQAEATRAQLRQASIERYQGASRMAAGIGLFSLLLVLACWRFFRTVLLEPLRVAQSHFDRIATGDLSAEIGVSGNNEISRLLHALRRMQQALIHTVSAIHDATGDVDQSARQIADRNQQLAARNASQAASLRQTASALQQLAAAVQQNADDTLCADRQAAGAASDAALGGNRVADIAATMHGMAAAGKQIAEMVGIIDGLAFQTNLLALNAAVEAARAGPQGRGFAVVAAEVRALALRSADAARQVQQVVEASTSSIADGAARVDEAEKTMAHIVGSVERVMGTMQRISQATTEQSAGLQHVHAAVAQMDRTTMQNASLVDVTTETVDALARQASRLVDAVAVFRIAADKKLAVL